MAHIKERLPSCETVEFVTKREPRVIKYNHFCWTMQPCLLKKKWSCKAKWPNTGFYTNSARTRVQWFFFVCWTLKMASKLLKQKSVGRGMDWCCQLSTMQHLYQNPCQRFQKFTSSLKPKHSPGSVLHNFSVRIRTGFSNMAWPHSETVELSPMNLELLTTIS